jgi:hypothetical protein
MVFSDIFSTSFLFSIAIIIILIAGIFAYVSYRMGEQDHKLNSMIGLVSTMAEETQFFRSKLNMLQQKILTPDLPTVDKVEYVSHMIGGTNKNELINVSDDEYASDDSEDEDSEDEDEDEDSEDEESEDEDSEDEDSEEEDEERDNIKILDLSLANIDNQDDQNIEELSICDFDISDNDTNQVQEIKTIHLEQPIELDDKKISEDDISFLKNVSINDLGEVEDSHTSKTDYKKMSLNKLRETAVSKGLISDASKLKKNEILKLLGDE